MKTIQLLTLPFMLVMIEASYPSYYDSDRYYGNAVRRSTVQWPPYRTLVRSQRSPVSYYTVYPYSQSYPDNNYRNYPQENYPIYYPRTSKFDVYAPSYYQKRLLDDTYDGYYYDVDPVETQEEMLQEIQREEREDSQPIGYEMLYENEYYPQSSSLSNYDRASIAYFQNLLAQRNQEDQLYNRDNLDYHDDYENDWQDVPATKLPPRRYKEDREVQDLRKLKAQKNSYLKTNSIHDDKKRSNGATTTKPETATTTTMTKTPDHEHGQKEEVMMRPATPVRYPFVIPMVNRPVNEERKRTPSVYDTIKRMLEMEKRLKNNEILKPVMKKRLVPSSDDDMLTHQLALLKKAHTK